MVFPLFKRWMYAATSMSSSNFTGDKQGHSYPLDSNVKNSGTGGTSRSHKRGGSIPLSGFHKKNYPHPLSIPNDTAWGSDEHIVQIDDDGKSWKEVEDRKSGITGKSSNETLGTLKEEAGVAIPPKTAAVSQKSGKGGFNDIVMTREWQVIEEHAEPEGRLSRRGNDEFGHRMSGR
jgi:hypothetical protein